MTPSYDFKTTPFKHQLDALAKSATKKNFAYFMEMGCVDGETEFLTTRGWVRFEDFDLATWERPLLVAQAVKTKVDGSEWGITFVEPEAYIKKPTTRWISLIETAREKEKILNRDPRTEKRIKVTTEHTFPVLRRDGYPPNSCDKYTQEELDLKKEEHLVPDMLITDIVKHTDFKKTTRKWPITPYDHIPCTFKGGVEFDSDYYEIHPDLQEIAKDEWKLRFMVACIADGTFPNKTNNKVDFYFKKERKVNRLRDIAAKAGIPLVCEKREWKVTNGHVQLQTEGAEEEKGNNVLYIIHAFAPIRCKVYDSRWYSLPQKCLDIIANECVYWDGNSTDPNRIHFYTSVKESADFIQYTWHTQGMRSSHVYNLVRKGYIITAGKDTAAESRAFKDDPFLEYAGPVKKRKATKEGEAAFKKLAFFNPCEYIDEKLKHREWAYCFRVPSGFLVLRRNNRIFLSGNSGKTKVMLDNIGMLKESGHITGALILAPKGVYRNWSAKEIPTHMPDRIKRDVLVWDAAASDGKKRKLQEQIKNWDGESLQFLVFNIESLISEKGKKLIVDFIKRHDGNVLALVDESTCIKNYKAKRTKAAIELGSKCKARRIATGSPITNSPLDLYSQCAFLDKALLGHGSYYSFKNTYADIERVPTRQGLFYEKVLRYKNLDHLSELLNSFSFRVTKKECLDLPEKIYMTRDVELTPEQEKVYRELYDYQFALLQDGENFQEMSTSVILTKMLRLHQVLCGTFTSDDGAITRLPNNRVDALKEVLDETSGKVIIWATYLEDIRAISEMLEKEYGKDSFVTYYGATTSEERTEAINKFQDDSSPVRFFLGNVQTAGRGITLTAASTVVYYSNNFSLELRQQSEDRAHRLGQKNNVTYIDLVVRGSLDEKIIKSLISKRNIANEILQDDLDDWISLKRRED